MATATSARTISLTLPRYHAGQRRVRQEARRFNVIACGRRWGKTTMCLRLVAETALDRDPAGWFAPTYKQLAPVWRDVADALEPVTARRSEQEKRLQLITGGVVDFWSLDEPDAARGRKYRRVVVDEAAHVKDLEHAWQHVIRPTLTDYSGDAFFPSTPFGRNFFWHLYQRGAVPDHPDWAAWRFPTTDNPHIPAADVEAARLELPERVYAQEYLGTFLETSGAVFRGVTEAATLAPQAPDRTHTYVVGVDWGRYQDFSVFSVLDATTREQVRLERFNQLDWGIQYARLKALCDDYRPALLVAERNAMGDPAASALRALGLPVWDFVTSNATKAAAVQALALALERGELRLLRDETQTGELLAFAAERLPSGLIRYAAPEGQHDDCVVALALSWVACEKDPDRPRTRSYSYAGQPSARTPSPFRTWRGPGVDPFSGGGATPAVNPYAERQR